MGSQKFRAIPGYFTLPVTKKIILKAFYIQTIHLCALVFPQLSTGVLGGGCEPPNLGKWRRKSRERYRPKEHW